MKNPTCMFCNNDLKMSIIKRKNNSYTGVCQKCNYTFAVSYDIENDVSCIVNIQKRFKFNNKLWHMTFRNVQDTTTFVTVQKQRKPEWKNGRKIEFPKDRIEHVINGLVLPEQFCRLIAFI